MSNIAVRRLLVRRLRAACEISSESAGAERRSPARRSLHNTASFQAESMEPRVLLSAAQPDTSLAIGIDLGPSVSVATPPATGDVVRQTTPYGIRWSASALAGVPVSISLFYDADNQPGGETPIANAQNLANTGDFTWSIPSSLIGQRVYIKGIASDIFGTSFSYSPGILTIRRPSTPPVITLPTSKLDYMSGGASLLVDPQAVLSDSDTTDFGGGSLNVTLDNAIKGDTLSVRNEGTGPGQISILENQVYYSGILIGLLRGGSGATPLTILLRQGATLPAVQSIIRNIEFSSTSTDLTRAPGVQIVLNDGSGGISKLASAGIIFKPILLQPVNYAVLWAGGADAGNNHVRYYNNIKQMYQTLVNKAGLSPSNIWVLFADGTDSAADQNPDNGGSYINSNMSYAAGAHVMAATHDNLNTVLNQLSNQVTFRDYFLFYSFDHGGGSFNAPAATGEETLTGWGSSVRDDELAPWLNAINAAHSTYIHTQCFSGGMQDNIQVTFNSGTEFSAAATNHYEYSWGDGFAHAFVQGLIAGARTTRDAYRYAYLNDPFATKGEGPGGTIVDQVEHPWSIGGNFRIFYNPNNVAPILPFSSITISGAPIPMWFGRGTVASITSTIDPNGDMPDFRVNSIGSGTLLLNGAPVAPGTIIGYGDYLQWIPPGGFGTFPAFSVSAWDGEKFSAVSTQIKVDVSIFGFLNIFGYLGPFGGNSAARAAAAPAIPFSGVADDASLDFGAVSLGDSAPGQFVLNNPSDSPLLISKFSVDAGKAFALSIVDGTGKPITLDNGQFTIPPQTSVALRIVFTPKVTGLQTGQISFLTNIPSDNGQPRILSFQGTGVGLHAPTLTKISELTGAFVGQPFEIPEQTLLQASDAADQDPGDILRFRIEQVLNGTLTLDGQPVVPGTTILDTGHSLVWTPSPDSVGDVPAFTVTAWDGSQASSPPITVNVRTLRAVQYTPGGYSNVCILRTALQIIPSFPLPRFVTVFEVFDSLDPNAKPVLTEPLANVGSFEFDGGLGNDTMIIDSALPFTPAFHGLAGHDKLIVHAGSYTFPSDLRFDTDYMTMMCDGSVRVALGGSQILDSLSIDGAAQVSLIPDSDSLLCTNHLFLGPNAALDLANNDMIDYGGSLGILIGLLKSGFADGKWTGPGIDSSSAAQNGFTTLAMLLNRDNSGDPMFKTFDDQTVGPDDVVVKYTWNGDVNLDGIVNADDYFAIDSGYITQRKGYQNGDLNYDNTINADDYFLVDSAYIGQNAVLSADQTPQPITQPKTQAAPSASILAQLFSTAPVL